MQMKCWRLTEGDYKTLKKSGEEAFLLLKSPILSSELKALDGPLRAREADRHLLVPTQGAADLRKWVSEAVIKVKLLEESPHAFGNPGGASDREHYSPIPGHRVEGLAPTLQKPLLAAITSSPSPLLLLLPSIYPPILCFHGYKLKEAGWTTASPKQAPAQAQWFTPSSPGAGSPLDPLPQNRSEFPPRVPKPPQGHTCQNHERPRGP